MTPQTIMPLEEAETILGMQAARIRMAGKFHGYLHADVQKDLDALESALHHLKAGKRDKAILDLLEKQDGIGIGHEGYGDYSYYANDANWPRLREVMGQLLDGTHYTQSQPKPKGES